MSDEEARAKAYREQAAIRRAFQRQVLLPAVRGSKAAAQALFGRTEARKGTRLDDHAGETAGGPEREPER